MFGGDPEKRDVATCGCVGKMSGRSMSQLGSILPLHVGSTGMIQGALRLWACRALWAQTGPHCLLTTRWLCSLGTLLELCGFHFLSCKLEVSISSQERCCEDLER